MKAGIIADDLTGANATGVRLSKQGFRTASTVFGLTQPQGNFDAICVDTDSRYATVDEARRRVRETVESMQTSGVNIFANGSTVPSGAISGRRSRHCWKCWGRDDSGGGPFFSRFREDDSGRISHGPRGSAATHRRGHGSDRSHPAFLYPRLLEQQTRYPIAFIELETILNGKPPSPRHCPVRLIRGTAWW